MRTRYPRPISVSERYVLLIVIAMAITVVVAVTVMRAVDNLTTSEDDVEASTTSHPLAGASTIEMIQFAQDNVSPQTSVANVDAVANIPEDARLYAGRTFSGPESALSQTSTTIVDALTHVPRDARLFGGRFHPNAQDLEALGISNYRALPKAERSEKIHVIGKEE